MFRTKYVKRRLNDSTVHGARHQRLGRRAGGARRAVRDAVQDLEHAELPNTEASLGFSVSDDGLVRLGRGRITASDRLPSVL